MSRRIRIRPTYRLILKWSVVGGLIGLAILLLVIKPIFFKPVQVLRLPAREVVDPAAIR